MQVGLQKSQRREAKRSTFEELAACLCGEPGCKDHWDDIVREANEHLVAPALFAALSGSRELEQVPDEVMAYLRLLHDLNRERNLRLKAQAVGAIGALNEVGIQPTLLKGASILLTCSEDRLGLRMISDLDLMIGPEQLPQAMAALAEQGYGAVAGIGDHAHASLFRPQDVGTIDIHHRPPGPACFYQDLSPLPDEIIEIDGSRARVPAATDRAIHLIVHDMIHDRRLWLGSVDLRHLLDLRDLIATGQVDWTLLRRQFRSGGLPSRLAMSLALEVLLINLRELLHVDLPAGGKSNVLPWLFYRRQISMAQYRWIRSVEPIYPAFRVYRKLRKSIGVTL